MKGDDHETHDDTLVEWARKGDPEAFGKLVVRYAPQVSALVYQHVGDPEATCDISQTVFFRAWRKIGTLQEVRSFRAWVFRIATNESVEHLRRERAQKRAPLHIARVPVEDVPASREPPLEWLVAQEERAAVVAALDQLPPKQRSAFVMRHFHGMTNREIAEVLSCSTNAVKANLSYALKSLREKLSGGACRG